MASQTASPISKEPTPVEEVEDDLEEIEEALNKVRQWNKTLKMSIIKKSGPWELHDLPVQYRPATSIPELSQYHNPPLFIFGIPFTADEIVQVAKRLGRYEEVLHKRPLYHNMFLREIIRKHVKEVCQMSKFRRNAEWCVYYSKEEKGPVPFFLCIGRSHDERGFRGLQELAKRVTNEFSDLGKHPMWYLEAIHNDLDRMDWRIKGIPGL